MNIENYDSVESFLKADAGEQSSVELSVTSVTVVDKTKVVTVKSKSSDDLDYRLRLDDTTTPVRVGDIAKVSVSDKTVVFETPDSPVVVKAAELKKARSSGCANYDCLR